MQHLASFFFLIALWGHAASACLKTADFSNCTTNAAQTSADCNNLVSDTPTLEYYQCLCKAGQGNLQCYALCPDDAQLQLQLQTIQKSVSASCQGVTDLQSQGFTTSASPLPSPSPTSTSSSSPLLATTSSPPPADATTSTHAGTVTSAPSSGHTSTGAAQVSGSLLLASGGNQPNGFSTGNNLIPLPQVQFPLSGAFATSHGWSGLLCLVAWLV
ncbi:hypothetical protein BC830DRAFT_1112760 [Chytriomyces sp. MP71]|nr:hypothetical protein BC830DRAFT_1112760 [Chytriomyces sp. MP71]